MGVEGLLRRDRTKPFRRLISILLLATICQQNGSAKQSDPESSSPRQAQDTNSFPALADIFQGRTFETAFERDVYFLKAIHDRYPQHWLSLLAANLTLEDYLKAPSKLLRFVEELGAAMAGSNDLRASTNVALIVSTKEFYANTNAYHPEILRATARALIKIGTTGREALASAFTEAHYRLDPESREELANEIGKSRPSGSELVKALTATAFDFKTTDGGFYASCTKTAVQNLLCLEQGSTAVQTRLTIQEVLENPGRFVEIVDAITAARASELTNHLNTIQASLSARLISSIDLPCPYRNGLQELETRIRESAAILRNPKKSKAMKPD